MAPYFCWLSLLSPKKLQKTPHFLVKCRLFDRSHPKTLPPCDTHFCHFGRCFLCANSCFGSAHRKIKSIWTFLPNAPNLEPKFGFSPNDPSFLETVFSPNAPAFGSVSLTPVSIWYWSAPTPGRSYIDNRSNHKVTMGGGQGALNFGSDGMIFSVNFFFKYGGAQGALNFGSDGMIGQTWNYSF